MTRTALALAVTTAVLTSGFANPASARDPIGVFGAAQPQVRASYENDTRQIETGSRVLFQDRVQTSSDGRAEIMFEDESRLSIGPDANIRITEAIYSPGDQSGSLALEATSGAMRFIGGALSKKDGQVNVETPLATLSIRGAIVLMDVSQGGLDVVMSHGNEVRVTTRSGEQRRLSRNGHGLSVGGNGEVVREPGAFSAAEVKALMSQLQTRPTGGDRPGNLPGETIDTERQRTDSGDDGDTHSAQQTADEELDELLSNIRRLSDRLAPGPTGSGRVSVGTSTGGDTTRRDTIRRQLR